MIFLRKKDDFCAFFRHGQRLVTEPGPTPSPRSIDKMEHNLQIFHIYYAIPFDICALLVTTVLITSTSRVQPGGNMRYN